MTLDIVKQILSNEHVSYDSIHLYQSKNGLTDYMINAKTMIRLSLQPLDNHKKQHLVHNIIYTPKVYYIGEYLHNDQVIHYMIFDYVQGEELFSILNQLNPISAQTIAKDISIFLKELHSITRDTYDIGFYIPTIPNVRSTWKNGHILYIAYLRDELMKLPKVPSHQAIIDEAMHYLEQHIDVLDYQRGPCLLHNDFHPKNIIVNDARVSGIIDWECAQYGEPDFDLVHLFHWSIFPPENEKSFDILIHLLLSEMTDIKTIPNLSTRFTIYQIEHELNQIIWSNNQTCEKRYEHLRGWLNHMMDFKLNAWLNK